MKHHKHTFETLAELAAIQHMGFACADNTDQHWYYRDRTPGWFCQDRKAGTQAEAVKLLEDPMFQAGVDRITQLAAEISAPQPRSRKRRAYRSEQGDDLDMDRVWQGELNTAWRAMRRETSVGPSRVLIVVNVTASGGTPAREMAMRGAAALALADALVSAGFCVQVSGASESDLCTAQPERHSFEAVLMPAGAPLDLHKLASLVASALLARGVIMDHKIRVAESAIDSGVSIPNKLQPDTFNTSGFDYVAALELGEVRDTYSAQRWIAKHIAALGGSQE